MPVSCTTEMTLGTLCVSVDATKKASVRTLQQQYGDGYVARRLDGVNTLMEIWNVSTVYSDVDALQDLEQEIIALGANSFAWTAPYETEEKRWILDPYSWDWDFSGDLARIKFTLKRFYR